MTTQAEIKQWVRPLIEWQPAMVQARHFLIFRPFRHVIRGLGFFGTSDRTSPNARWFLFPIFMAQGLMRVFDVGIPVGFSDRPGFQDRLEERAKESISRYLLPNESIQQFYDFALTAQVVTFGRLDRLTPQHGIVLSALGRFREAEALLAPAVEELEKGGRAWSERGQNLLARRTNSSTGKQAIRFGEQDLVVASRLRRLLACLRDNDRGAIATLLHDWEQENVTEWQVAQYWQPTPFPFESA